MNSDKQQREDAQLKELLSSWTPTGRLPANFGNTVWNRIHAWEDQPPLLALIRERFQVWLRTSFTTPAAAFSCVALLLVIGGATGWVQARHESARVTEELSNRYVHSVAPAVNWQ